MNKNNIKDRLRTANTNTPTTASAAALAELIERSDYSCQHPPSLGLEHSIKITLAYLEHNLTQRFLAQLFHTSQSSVCRAINAIIDALDSVLDDAPEPSEIPEDIPLVVDGTIIPILARDRDLYSHKKKNFRFNLQVITADTGAILYLSHPQPGSMHDKTALEHTGVLDVIDRSMITADKGYQGTGCKTPVKRRSKQIPLTDDEHQYNQRIGKVRYVVEQSIAHVKRWKILATGCQLSRMNYSSDPYDAETVFLRLLPNQAHFA